MNVYRIIVACLLACSFFPGAADAGRRCTGASLCSACTTCSGCKHCKSGGTCGVCSSRATPPSVDEDRSASPFTVAPYIPPQRPAPPADRAKAAQPRPQRAAAVEDGIAVLFSPSGGCTAAIVEHISMATSTIDVQAYRLTSPPIVKALREAHERRVRVRVLLDGSQQSDRYSDATYFHNAGIDVLIDDTHKIAHNKVVIIDRATVITGSFNFSAAAENDNAENLLVIAGKEKIAEAYVENFASHWAHAIEYVPPKS